MRWTTRPSGDGSSRGGHGGQLERRHLTVGQRLEGARVTGGRYDPTVLGDVLRAGYDRSFELLSDGTGRGTSPLRRGWDLVRLDSARSTVTLPSGVGFDPGGIGKGYAADLLVEELLSRGAAGACVNLGGDLRVHGSAPNRESWVIAIGHPLRPGSRPAAAWPRRPRSRPRDGRPRCSPKPPSSVASATGWRC